MVALHAVPRLFRDMTTSQASPPRFGDAVASHRPYLYRIALLHLQDRAAAEDAVQEAMLAALAGEARFENRSSLKTWLLSILKFKVLDAIRARQRLTPLPDISDANDDELDLTPLNVLFDANGYWAEPKKAWGDPYSAAERSAFLRVLDDCLTRLPERTSRAFLMREWLEVEPTDICTQLKLSPGNLRILLYRARMQLRHCLEINWEAET